MSPDSQSLKTLLAGLYAEEMRNPREYIRYHASPQAISAKVNSFLAYADHLPTTGRILDWGCQQAPDACMVKAALPGVQLDGCDFLPPASYPAFWNYCGFTFTTLTDHIELPYEANTFDAVIGGGALEHTAMDYESLKQLWRILKPGGVLVLTYLPNRYSYTEFATRHWSKGYAHQRLYTVASISRLLLQTGFLPEIVRRHRFLPTNSLPGVTRVLSPYEGLIDRIWPLNLLCGDILVVARKVHAF